MFCYYRHKVYWTPFFPIFTFNSNFLGKSTRLNNALTHPSPTGRGGGKAESLDGGVNSKPETRNLELEAWNLELETRNKQLETIFYVR